MTRKSRRNEVSNNDRKKKGNGEKHIPEKSMKKPAKADDRPCCPAPTEAWYLRVEGLNIDACILDTTQLSVTRGGSLLLRQAARDIGRQIEVGGFGKAISTGASIGEYHLEATDESEARRIIDDLLRLLVVSPFSHLTFAVADEPIGPKPAHETRERALAKIRFEQMRMPTLSPPPRNDKNEVGVCEWEGRRPADSQHTINREGENPVSVSQSVRDRYEYGVKQKRAFYNEETGRDDQCDYTNDLSQIAHWPEMGNLHGKVAVIYADGNRFSAIRGKACPRFPDLTRFDNEIQGRRREFLDRLLSAIAKDPGFHTEDGRHRIETLLWGGDELRLVVPAWRGFEVLQAFYEATADWYFKGEDSRNQPWPLTHAAGIVFCRAKTPIQRSQALAGQLAEGVKRRLKAAAKGRSDDAKLRDSLRNAYDYAILESIDVPTEPHLDRFFSLRYCDAGSLREHQIPLRRWRVDLADDTRELLDALPKGQVYAVARAAVNAGTTWDTQQGVAAYRDRVGRMKEVLGKEFEPLAARVGALFGDPRPLQVPGVDVPLPHPWPWVHLSELWDYLAPPMLREVAK